MSHLVCCNHDRRVFVLPSATVIHRSDSTACSTIAVIINGRAFAPREVAQIIAPLSVINQPAAKVLLSEIFTDPWALKMAATFVAVRNERQLRRL